jgi:hypothetical protein
MGVRAERARRCAISVDDILLRKIASLRELGFGDPVKPEILSCAIDKVGAKLAALREGGVVNPVKMITSHPKILSYSIDNICSKIAILSELGFVTR